MAESKDVCLSVSKFKCCKTKVFTHFICTKCFNIFHKSCLLRDKSGIVFTSENKIICCGKDSDWTDEEQDLSILEKTISELDEDNKIKNLHIQKLKKKYEVMTQEALEMENSLNKIIQDKQDQIDELMQEIKYLNKNLKKKEYRNKNCKHPN